MMLARALLKRYGIVFPMKGRSTEEQKKVNESEDGSQWLSYDLSADVTSKWASNMSRSEGSTFWVKMVRKPVLEEIALKKQQKYLVRQPMLGWDTARHSVS